MKEKTLERLLVDRKLNELSLDASELLEEFLRIQPRLAPVAEEIDATVDLVRKAITPAADDCPLPPPRFLTETRLTPHRALRFLRFRPWAIAAAVLFAFLAGSAWGPRLSPNGMPSSQVASRELTKIEPVAGQFWSLHRIRHGAVHGTEGTSTQIRWVSPLAWPQNGDRS